jgi:hypothetical protein
MKTAFRLVPSTAKHSLDLTLLQQSLPRTLNVRTEEDGLYIDVESESAEDSKAQFLLERELDRVFFLTLVRFTAVMVTRVVTASSTFHYVIQGQLPQDIQPMDWTYEKAIQFRLWATAMEVHDPLVRILLLYQIIELEQPNFPAYPDASVPPHPLTECKMLRHLVAHAGDVKRPDLRRYCKHLGLPALMLDRTDPAYVEVVSRKLPLLEAEARRVLCKAT